MRAPQCFWLGVILAGATLTACAGGRGSSGFDISENAAIGRAIDTRQCVGRQGLTICPADQAATPVLPPSTPTRSATPQPPTPVTATPTMSTSPTPTLTPTPPPRIDTGLGEQTSITCVQATPGGACGLTFNFAPQGFPHMAIFRVASRAAAPIGPWQLASEPAPGGAPDEPHFDATVLASTAGEPPPRVQLAVLVFFEPPQSIPGEFRELVDTGAEYAFVTPELLVDVQRAFPSPTPADTPAPEGGPQITYFGIARSDEVTLAPTAFDRDGRPIYLRPTGQGMFLVIEARHGSAGSPVGRNAFNPAGGLPDVQILVSRPLGDGSVAVCAGGVPPTHPLHFSDTPAVGDAINDLGCHVNDGAGKPVGRNTPTDACTRSDTPGGFGYGFVDSSSTVQYCLPIEHAWSFPPGDTIVAARVRDVDGGVGLTQQIVVRVGPVVATPTRPGASPTVSVPTVSPSPVLATPVPSETIPPESGPQITYFGITRPDSVPVTPTASDPEGRPIYDRLDGFGMVVVVEARPGSSASRVGIRAFNADGGPPDLQIVLSRPLGDGSAAVCDKARPNIGGVPGTQPLAFSDAPSVVQAMNDLGCRVRDGAGEPVGVQVSGDACTRPNEPSGDYGFIDTASTIQYCLPIAAAWAFPTGETVLAARVRDVSGAVGLTHEIVVRVGAPAATPTGPTATRSSATPTATATRTPTPTGTPLPPGSGPQITYFGVARADDVPMTPAAADEEGRPIYVRPSGQGMFLVIEARPGAAGNGVGVDAFDASGGLPDLQIIVSRPLGNGSELVCDDALPNIGGVPATDPLSFSDAPEVAAAINDLGCRVNDGAGNPVGRTASPQACTRTDAPGGFGFGYVDVNSTMQYCLPIARPWGFPVGDTIVAVRVRDTDGVLSASKEIVVRVTPSP
jgi:hypothetical protein